MVRNLRLGMVVLAALMLSVGSAHAEHWKWIDLHWLTHSGGGQAVPSIANGGVVDSLTISGAGSAATDTSASFTLDDLAKYSYPPYKTTGVGAWYQRTAVKDTSRAIVLEFYPDAASSYTEEMAATDDVVLQGSFDGIEWVTLITGKSFTELASGNDHFAMELKSDTYYGATTGYATDTSDETTWWGLPVYRFIVTHTINGQFKASLRYWAED